MFLRLCVYRCFIIEKKLQIKSPHPLMHFLFWGRGRGERGGIYHQGFF